jgi:hypothetical protein
MLPISFPRHAHLDAFFVGRLHYNEKEKSRDLPHPHRRIAPPTGMVMALVARRKSLSPSVHNVPTSIEGTRLSERQKFPAGGAVLIRHRDTMR